MGLVLADWMIEDWAREERRRKGMGEEHRTMSNRKSTVNSVVNRDIGIIILGISNKPPGIIRVSETTGMTINRMWDGGSRDAYDFLSFTYNSEKKKIVGTEIATLEIEEIGFLGNARPKPFVLPELMACLRSGRSQGKASTPHLFLHPNDYTRLVEEDQLCRNENHPDCLRDREIALDCYQVALANILSSRELKIMDALSMTGNYRKDALARLKTTSIDLSALNSRGYIKSHGKGWTITDEGRMLLDNRRESKTTRAPKEDSE